MALKKSKDKDNLKSKAKEKGKEKPKAKAKSKTPSPYDGLNDEEKFRQMKRDWIMGKYKVS